MYSDKVMDHFANPRNVGVLADADGVGQVGNPVCGDMMTFYIMAKGRTLDEGMAITNELVAQELGGLPKNKMHCSNLGADALHEAIKNYRDRQAGRGARTEGTVDLHEHGSCACPYCETVLEDEDKTFCRACRVEFEECPGITKKGDRACVHCGAPLGGKG
jgi:nitrogen fixation NifU-like protein